MFFHLIDNRKKSKTFNNEFKISISKKNFKALVIPPNIWFSLRSLNNKSIVINILDRIHSKNETKKSEIIKNIKIPN